MVWMAVFIKIILCSSTFNFCFSEFSDDFVFRRGGSLLWISKIFNQLIFSLSSRIFSFQFNIACVVLSCFVIEMVWYKYVHWNSYAHVYPCMYYILCVIVLFWQIIHINKPVFYILYFILILWRLINTVCFFKLFFFLWHIFFIKKILSTYVLISCVNVKIS